MRDTKHYDPRDLEIQSLRDEVRQLSTIEDYQRSRIQNLKNELAWKEKMLDHYQSIVENAFKLCDIIRAQGDIKYETHKFRNEDNAD